MQTIFNAYIFVLLIFRSAIYFLLVDLSNIVIYKISAIIKVFIEPKQELEIKKYKLKILFAYRYDMQACQLIWSTKIPGIY